MYHIGYNIAILYEICSYIIYLYMLETLCWKALEPMDSITWYTGYLLLQDLIYSTDNAFSKRVKSKNHGRGAKECHMHCRWCAVINIREVNVRGCLGLGIVSKTTNTKIPLLMEGLQERPGNKAECADQNCRLLWIVGNYEIQFLRCLTTKAVNVVNGGVFLVVNLIQAWHKNNVNFSIFCNSAVKKDSCSRLIESIAELGRTVCHVRRISLDVHSIRVQLYKVKIQITESCH